MFASEENIYDIDITQDIHRRPYERSLLRVRLNTDVSEWSFVLRYNQYIWANDRISHDAIVGGEMDSSVFNLDDATSGVVYIELPANVLWEGKIINFNLIVDSGNGPWVLCGFTVSTMR